MVVVVEIVVVVVGGSVVVVGANVVVVGGIVVVVVSKVVVVGGTVVVVGSKVVVVVSFPCCTPMTPPIGGFGLPKIEEIQELMSSNIEADATPVINKIAKIPRI